MTRLFAITPNTVSTRLGAERRGRMSFTVSNTDEEPRNVRFYLVPGDDVEENWLAIGGEREHDLAPGATHEVPVDIELPAVVEEGKYNFRLDVVSVADPDEDFTEGPVVSFAAPPAVPVKKPFPWRLVAAAAALVLLVMAAWWLWPGSPSPAAESEIVAQQAGEGESSDQAKQKDRLQDGPRAGSDSEPAAAEPAQEPTEAPTPSAWKKFLLVFLVLAALGGMGTAVWFFRRPSSQVRRKK